MSLYDYYTVVSVQAGVWRCERCGQHLTSPIEHEKECPVVLFGEKHSG